MIVAGKTGGVVNVIFYPEHVEPGYSAKKEKKVDAEIAALVQRASDEQKGDAAQKAGRSRQKNI